jgi:hypothetical protein
MTTKRGKPSPLDNPVLAEHAAEIRKLGTRAIGDVIEIGGRLFEAKKIAGHGNWLPWLEREFGWSDRTAENYMRVYTLSTKFETVSNLCLDLRSLYLLTAKSTPQEAQDEIIARVEAGEQVTVADVKTVIAKRKPDPKQPKPKKYINPAAAALFANEDQLHAFAAVMRTPGARRFITFEQQVDLAKELTEGNIRAAAYQPWVSNWLRQAGKLQGRIDAEEKDDIYKQFPGYEIRDEVAAVKSIARSLTAALLKLEELVKKFPAHPFLGDIGSTLDGVINVIRQYRRAADEKSADKNERKLARLQELEQKTRTQEITIEGLRSEIEEAKAAAPSAERKGLAEKLEPLIEGLFREGIASAATASPPAVMIAVTKLERLLVEHGILPKSRRYEDPQAYVRALRAKTARERRKEPPPKNANDAAPPPALGDLDDPEAKP